MCETHGKYTKIKILRNQKNKSKTNKLRNKYCGKHLTIGKWISNFEVDSGQFNLEKVNGTIYSRSYIIWHYKCGMEITVSII